MKLYFKYAHEKNKKKKSSVLATDAHVLKDEKEEEAAAGSSSVETKSGGVEESKSSYESLKLEDGAADVGGPARVEVNDLHFSPPKGYNSVYTNLSDKGIKKTSLKVVCYATNVPLVT